MSRFDSSCSQTCHAILIACSCLHLHLQVKGLNLRKWILGNSKQLPKMLDALGKLVMADKLKVAYTE